MMVSRNNSVKKYCRLWTSMSKDTNSFQTRKIQVYRRVYHRKIATLLANMLLQAYDQLLSASIITSLLKKYWKKYSFLKKLHKKIISIYLKWAKVEMVRK